MGDTVLALCRGTQEKGKTGENRMKLSLAQEVVRF
jgi:hypothetical protein